MREYQNEIIISVSFIFMILAYGYKSSQSSTKLLEENKIKHSIKQLQEVIALKKLWGNKKTSLKVKKFKNTIDIQKTRWSNKRKKLTVSYNTLTPNELNKVTTKILNIPVQIIKLKIDKTNKQYNVELKCKW